MVNIVAGNKSMNNLSLFFKFFNKGRCLYANNIPMPLKKKELVNFNYRYYEMKPTI